MKRKMGVLILWGLVVFTIGISTTEAYYNVIDLGTLGGNYSDALSVNNNGQIVGFSNQHACLFDPSGNGNVLDLGTLGGDYSYAYSINDNTQIVGQASGGERLACLFDSSGGGNNINLGLGQANSINNNGQIVGAVGNRATIFDSSGGGNNIDLKANGQANCINNNGQIVGYFYNNSIYHHACLFDSTGLGNNVDLGTLGGSLSESKALSINNSGQVVGIASGHACLFDLTGNGNNIDLGTLGGSTSSANFINNNGQIVGWARTISTDDVHACLFDITGSGNNIDLNALISPTCGWELRWANSINNNGWIVGGGNYNGQTHAYLLVIPEPSTFCMLGLLTFFTRKRGGICPKG